MVVQKVRLVYSYKVHPTPFSTPFPTSMKKVYLVAVSLLYYINLVYILFAPPSSLFILGNDFYTRY